MGTKTRNKEKKKKAKKESVIHLPKLDLKPRTKMDEKGRVLIDKLIREQLELKPGAIFEIEVWEGGKILLTHLG